MSRINTNVSSLISQRLHAQNNKALNHSLERLSTGLRINRGADDPAGLIASENLRSEKAGITAGINNAERADQVLSIAEGGLREISGLLTELQGLVTESANDAGLSQEEKEANQLQVDSILQTIDRLASTTSFQGVKLLNGTFDFQVDGVDSNVTDYKINTFKLQHGQSQDVQLIVTQSAQRGTLFLSTNGALDLTDADSLFVFELAGAKGSREFSFASGTTLASIASAVNGFTEVTGVSAAVSGTGIEFKATELGDSEFVSFKVVTQGGQAGAVHLASAVDDGVASTEAGQSFALGSFTSPIRDAGQDIGGTINGVVGVGDGGNIRVNNDIMDLELDLADAASQALGTLDAFTVSGGGATFMLGPDVNITNKTQIGIANVASRHLGRSSIGFLDDLASGGSANVVNGNKETAQKVVDSAISDISNLRARLGAYQKNVVGSTIRALGVALENTSSAESAIRDTDFASETASLTRAQILASASTNVLSIANSQPQQALALLG